MSAGNAVVITGIKPIDRKLRSLLPRVQKKVARQSMRAGLKVVAQEVEAQAPVDKGTMRNAVQVRAVKRKKRGTIEMECRILATEELKRTSGRTGKVVFYPAIVQYGQEGIPPDAFMTRAFEAKGEQARQTTISRLEAGVEREVANS